MDVSGAYSTINPQLLDALGRAGTVADADREVTADAAEREAWEHAFAVGGRDDAHAASGVRDAGEVLLELRVSTSRDGAATGLDVPTEPVPATTEPRELAGYVASPLA